MFFVDFSGIIAIVAYFISTYSSDICLFDAGIFLFFFKGLEIINKI